MCSCYENNGIALPRVPARHADVWLCELPPVPRGRVVKTDAGSLRDGPIPDRSGSRCARSGLSEVLLVSRSQRDDTVKR